MHEDGYYRFLVDEPSGYWSSYALRHVAEKLDELNREWDQQVEKEVGNGK
jgi:hypothetical protein